MSASRLREAAARLRKVASKVDSENVSPAPESVMGVWLNSRYYATMHPPVALALADWLTDLANWFEYGNTTPGDHRHGLAVANAILGGDQ